MAWLLLFLVLAHQQDGAPHRPPPPPVDPTADMWVGLVLGIVCAIPLAPFAWRAGPQVVEAIVARWKARTRGVGIGE